MILRYFKKASSRTPNLPDGVRIFAIGDIHGRADLLKACFEKIDKQLHDDPAVRPIHIAIGDYVDRGPNSRGVLDLLCERSKQFEMVLIRGNHEQALTEFLAAPSSLDSWARIGGLETLMSYGLKPPLSSSAAEQKELAAALRLAMPAEHRALLSNLLPSFSCGKYFFTHGGVRPGVSLARQTENDLMWIRDEFLLCEEPYERIIVHGHTPVREVDIRPNRINIDTGAYATGRLTCLVFRPDKLELL